MPTTFDNHTQHQTVPYVDAALPKRKTTHDIAVAELTVEHPPIEIGALQVLGSETYEWNGSEWVICP